MEEPRAEHMVGLKHLLRYVSAMIDFGLNYGCSTEELKLKGYSDSDLAGDVDDRKSTIGLLFFLGDNPITRLSQKQRVVAQSTC
jgi:hypothetical protein